MRRSTRHRLRQRALYLGVVAFCALLAVWLATWGEAADTRYYQPPSGGGAEIGLTATGTSDLLDETTGTARTLSNYNSACTTNCMTIVTLNIRGNPNDNLVNGCTANGQAPLAGTDQFVRRNNAGVYCALYAGQTGTYDIACGPWATARANAITVRTYENVNQTTIRDLDAAASAAGVSSSTLTLSGLLASDMMIDSAHIDVSDAISPDTGQTVEIDGDFGSQTVWSSRLQGTGDVTSTISWTPTVNPVAHCAYALQEAP